MAFINDITLGQYYYTDSFVHRLDPRTKLLASLLAMTALLFSFKPVVLAGYVLLMVVTTRCARLPGGLVFRNLRPFFWLFLLTLLFHGFFTRGELLWRIPLIGADLTVQGLERGVLYSARLGILVVFAALFTLTTSPIEMTDGLEKLLRPAKKLGMPTHELTMMMSLSLRFIPTLLQEADRLQKAQVSRGATFEGGVLKRIKGVLPLILPLFISSFRRADELAMAMDSRCYAGGEGRTSFKQLRFSALDYAVMTGFVFLLALTMLR